MPRSRPGDGKRALEETIVHELFHLKLIAEGFPAIKFEVAWEAPPDETVLKANKEAEDNIRDFLYDPIVHWTFYPRIREMGMDPGNVRKANFHTRRQEDNVKGLEEDYSRAEYFFAAAMEYGDPQLLEELASWFRSKGWNHSFMQGMNLAMVVERLNPQTPEAAITALLGCLSYLHGGKTRFGPPRWERVRRGSLNVLVVVIPVAANK